MLQIYFPILVCLDHKWRIRWEEESQNITNKLYYLISTPIFWEIGRHKGKPGEGTRKLLPASQRVAKVSYKAPEQPKVNTTSLAVNG
jgi:hypothetical protein